MSPRRWSRTAAVAGLLLGGAAAAWRAPPPVAAPVVAGAAASPSPVATPGLGEVRPAASPSPRVLLAWTPGGLPDGLAARVAAAAGVRRTTVVRAGRVDLLATRTATGQTVDRLRPGWAIPVDALVIDRRYRRLLPHAARAEFDALRPGSVLLGGTSARVRRLDAGDSLLLDGAGELRVAGVVDDTLVGAAEIVVGSADAARIGVTVPRFLLVEYAGRRARVEAAIRRAAPPGTTLRIRGPGEAPYLRHGDAVLPQAIVKDLFGEFAYRPGGAREFTPDPRWVARNIVDADVPVLGEVRCHRAFVPALRGALSELRRQGLGHLVDPDEFRGCYNPRLITAGGAVSRHAWGIAVDLNAGANPTGIGSGQDPRLVAVMERWGLGWGGFWLVPDPMHFEYVRPPAATAAGERG